jgi:hypothetical protein
MKPYLAMLSLFLWGCSPAWGSFRVYQLRLRHYDQIGKKKIDRLVLTTMDPKQYESFYGGPAVIHVELADTWYCPGDTSHKKFCKKPKEPPERWPANLDHAKRTKLPYRLQPYIP